MLVAIGYGLLFVCPECLPEAVATVSTVPHASGRRLRTPGCPGRVTAAAVGRWPPRRRFPAAAVACCVMASLKRRQHFVQFRKLPIRVLTHGSRCFH